MKKKVSIFWFRRDLRLSDNTGLHHALHSNDEVLPLFIFDETILSKLENKKDRRVDYIHQALNKINSELKSYGTTLTTFCGNPLSIYKKLIEEYDVQAVFCNRDYEPNAIDRDKEIYYFLKEHNISLKGYKDQVIFDRNEILKKDGKPYTVYTPYSKKWKEALKKEHYTAYDLNVDNFYKLPFSDIHSLEDLGFEKSDMEFDSPILDKSIIDEYDKYRDFPAIQKTTQLGIALRFGTISTRKCVEFALNHNEVWLSELIWREFFMQILYHFPKVVHQSFKIKYDEIKWRNNEQEFQKWCDGKTGYPIVDAGMRQLNQTGYMHNRVRMIVASFLCKHLLIDWRWGETYFAQLLNDYDLSANNGNWQWAAGSGCDAAPYFRVFNPEIQTTKFDKDLKYIKKWVPEYGTNKYVKPIVEHRFARERALQVYGETLKE
ncbi:deoxyribodipyrimidine photo-lyase [Chishuiella sp.]|uniref:cryptochrome/photolyase family protein n=1 Tax=Chishuiella sp. TaxID=1969467 RepID=UPI0028A8EDBD|nr:deoxyribodipyrimidine photo-lyase [Chishuiella sp.]